MTATAIRSCAWCGDRIPATMRNGVRYCSRKCSRDAHRGAKVKRKSAGMFRPNVLELRLRERERQVIAESRGMP